MLPCTQRHGEFEVTFEAIRGLFQDSHCDTLELQLPVPLHPSSRTSRQTRQLPVKIVSSQRSSHPRSHIAFLTEDFVSGTFHRYYFQRPDAPPRGADFVGWRSSTTQLKNPSGILKDSVTFSPDYTLCLDTSPRAVTWFSGRCPDS